MKNLPFLCIALLLVSCIDYYKIETTINADGTITRTFIVKGDSSSIFEGHLKVPNDSSWHITIENSYENPNDTASKKKLLYKATKTFLSYEDLNKELFIPKDSVYHAKISTYFNKSFKWFFSTINYSETFRKKMPFDYFPVNDFMTDNELSLFYDDDFTYVPNLDSLIHIKNLDSIPKLTHADSLRYKELSEAIYKKWFNWHSINVYEEYFNLLLKTKKDDEKPYYLSRKEEMYRKSEFHKVSELDIHSSSESCFDSLHKFFDLKEEYIVKQFPDELESFNNKLNQIENVFHSNTITYQMNLPGMLLRTNADSISGSSAYWKFEENKYYNEDYSIFAQSRIVNKWIIAITGIVTLILLGLWFLSFRKKQLIK